MLNTGRGKSKSVRLDPGRVGDNGGGDDALDDLHVGLTSDDALQDLGPTVPLTRSGGSQRGKGDNRVTVLLLA